MNNDGLGVMYIDDEGDMGDIDIDELPDIEFIDSKGEDVTVPHITTELKMKPILLEQEQKEDEPTTTENTLQQQVIQSEEKKLYKRGVFDERENGLIRLFCKLGKSDIEVYSPSKDKKLTEDYVYGVNMYSHENEQLPTGLYTSLGIRYQDFVHYLHVILNRKRNILLQNEYKARLVAKFPENDEDFRYIYPLLKNGVIYTSPKNKEDIIKMRKLATFIPWLAYVYEHQHNKQYVISKSPVNMKLPSIKEKVIIVEIPRDIQKKLMRPGRYFNELSKILQYNEQNGFYSYLVDGKLIPVMCIHEYMTYQGKLSSEIAQLCYKDGFCKYCGQELVAYHEKLDDNVPVKMYDIIYKFISAINLNVDDIMLLHSFYSLIGSCIDSIKHRTNIFNNNYETVVVAYTGVYLYAVYKRTKNDIKYNTSKINKFIDDANIYWLDVGWSKSQVNQLIEDNSILPNLDGVPDIIKTCLFQVDNKLYADIVPASVLLGRLINPREDITTDGLDKLQKIFIQSFKNGEYFIGSPMDKFNKEFNIKLLSIWRYLNIKKVIKNIKNVKTSSKPLLLKCTVNKDYEKFWNAMYKQYCPASNINIHEFVKGKCKWCDLKTDYKNMKNVYDKYIDVISSTFLQIPSLISTTSLKIKTLYTEEDINKFDVHVLDSDVPVNVDKLSFLPISSVEKNILINRLNNYINKLNNLINDILNIDIKVKSIDHLKKIFAFIVGKNVMNPVQLVSEIKNICFPISSVDLMLMSMNVES